jgi:hypothetical protein
MGASEEEPLRLQKLELFLPSDVELEQRALKVNASSINYRLEMPSPQWIVRQH